MMEIVLVMSMSPLFLFCVRIMEFKYCFGKSYDTNLYENELFLKLYNRKLTKCAHLIVKLHLKDTMRIAILLIKIQNLVTSLTWKERRKKYRNQSTHNAYVIKIKHQFFDTWLTARHISTEKYHAIAISLRKNVVILLNI